jgi:tight adherence protein B
VLPILAALGFLVVAATAMFFALAISRGTRVSLENRIGLAFVGSKSWSSLPVQPAGRTSHARPLDERLRGVFTLGLAHTWGMHAKPLFLILGGVVGAVLAWAAASFLLNLPAWLAALAGLIAFAALPRFLLVREQAKSAKQFINLFPDAVDMGVRMLRAGLPITAAMRAISNDAPTPVNEVFKTVADQVEIGIPFEQALALAGERVGVADFRFFAVAVGLQRATGGNLASTLEILSDIMRKRRAVRLKAQATTAEVRVSAYILGAMPFLVTGVLLLIQPAYLEPLISDRRGKFIVGGAVAMLTMGFLLMRKMMRSAVRM